MPISGPTSDHRVIRHWADSNHFLPAEQLPNRVDSEPAELRLIPISHVDTQAGLRAISWEEFFSKFTQLGLAFIYDEDSTGYNQILQIEDKSPYRHPAYHARTLQN